MYIAIHIACIPADYYIFQPLSFLVDGEQQRDQQLTGQCAENKAL